MKRSKAAVEKDNAKIEKLLAKPRTAHELAEALGCDVRTIYRRLQGRDDIARLGSGRDPRYIMI